MVEKIVLNWKFMEEGIRRSEVGDVMRDGHQGF